MKVLVSILLLLATAQARFLSATATVSVNLTISYDATLRCGACIEGGYIYCHKAEEGAVVTGDVPLVNRTCCKDAKTCP